jgi:hypothetical protein
MIQIFVSIEQGCVRQDLTFWNIQIKNMLWRPNMAIWHTQEAAEGRMVHNNGQNRANGMTNTWKPCVWCIWYNSTPAITTSPCSPINVPPTSCALTCRIRNNVGPIHGNSICTVRQRLANKRGQRCMFTWLLLSSILGTSLPHWSCHLKWYRLNLGWGKGYD